MTEYSEEWGKCIRELLERHNLTTRTAEAKTGGKVSNSYIYVMTKGKVPEYGKAYELLVVFPKAEAIECLRAAGIPIPLDWYDDPVEAVEAALENITTIPKESVHRIKEFVKDVEREHGLAHEHRDCAEEEVERV